ncbi:MAG: hypothetical protein JWQ61_2017 [Collimonas fungivorans]|uniref:hypothetical protein n=1 Tax=Collimonas fungivorans TaxID=158899 RepID=UPI0026E9FD0F|nr:hypothetical protein [Collimonas fungivorans]MDB5767203.1 hypothetical protein [Collimonas fungivorans]
MLLCSIQFQSYQENNTNAYAGECYGNDRRGYRLAPAEKKQLVTELSVLILLIPHVVQFVEIQLQRLFMKIYPCSVLLALTLAGCGGGGSGNDETSASRAASVPALSSVQTSYESFALAANGGLHFVDGVLNYSVSSSGVLSFAPGSYLYTNDSSIPQSAANGTQTLSVGFSPTAKSLPLPPSSVPSRYLINGIVFTAASPTQNQVTYVGNNVLEKYLATDGKTVVRALLGTSYKVTPLSGLIATTSAELFNRSKLAMLEPTIDGTALYDHQASWQTGSAYMEVIRQYVGDTLGVGDCLKPTTTGPNITPCASTGSALEGFFPHVSPNDGLTYQIGDGQIVTLSGVRAWVATAPFTNAVTKDYRVYYESNGAIYSGILTRDGTQIQVAPFGIVQDFYLFMNNAAVQSIKSAVNF